MNMPVQKTFTLIPAAPSRHASPAPPTDGRPQIMTSKQIKAAHKAANKAPKLTRAEQRQREKAEQARIRKEFEKEKAAAKARLLRDKKKEKEEIEKAEKKKRGLPTAKVRPSQGMIAGWVTGKKRNMEGTVVNKPKPHLSSSKGHADGVLEAVTEEDARGSKTESLAARNVVDQQSTKTSPRDMPHQDENEILPTEELAALLSQADEARSSKEREGLENAGPNTTTHSVIPKASTLDRTGTGSKGPSESFDLDLDDDIESALSMIWNPPGEAKKPSVSLDHIAIDLGLSSPHQQVPSPSPQPHSLGNGADLRKARAEETQHDASQSKSKQGPDMRATDASGRLAGQGSPFQDHYHSQHRTGNAPQVMSAAELQTKQQSRCFDPRKVQSESLLESQRPTAQGSTGSHFSPAEILSGGDLELDDDLLGGLIIPEPVKTTTGNSENVPLPGHAGEAFGLCSQDLEDLEILDAVTLLKGGKPGEPCGSQSVNSKALTAVYTKTMGEPDDFDGLLDDDITLSQLPPVTPRGQALDANLQRVGRPLEETRLATPPALDRLKPMQPPPLPETASPESRTSGSSPTQQLPPPSTQAIMLNPSDFFPTSSQQALELEEQSPTVSRKVATPMLPRAAAPATRSGTPAQPSTSQKQQISPSTAREQNLAAPQAPPPPSSPPQRFFTSSGSRSRHSLKMLQEKRARDREELRKMDERRVEKGRLEAETRRMEREKRRAEEERWKHSQERRLKQSQQKATQWSRLGRSRVGGRSAVETPSGKENMMPKGKLPGGPDRVAHQITEGTASEFRVSASQDSFGGDWVDDLDIDLTVQ